MLAWCRLWWRLNIWWGWWLFPWSLSQRSVKILPQPQPKDPVITHQLKVVPKELTRFFNSQNLHMENAYRMWLRNNQFQPWGWLIQSTSGIQKEPISLQLILDNLIYPTEFVDKDFLFLVSCPRGAEPLPLLSGTWWLLCLIFIQLPIDCHLFIRLPP